MRNNYLVNIALFSLCIGLYFFLYHEPEQKTAATALSLIDPQTVQQITISQAKRQDITLIKQDTHWQLETPLRARANTTRVQLLLSLLKQQPYRQQTIEQRTLDSFGLGQKAITLTLDTAQFHFGNTEPLSKRRYVSHNNMLYLLDDTIYPLLNTVATSFIDNRLLSKETELTSLSLPFVKENTLSNEALTINKVDGHWQSQTKHKTDELTQLVTAWRQAQAVQVLPLTSIDHNKLNSPNVTLRTDKAIIELYLMIEDSHTLIVNPKNNLAYQFPKAIIQQLLLSVE